MNILADHPDVVLATGHLSREEVDALVRRCVQLGVNRVLVTHPHFLVDASAGDMRNWQSLGAYMEITAVISLLSSPIYCRPVEEVADLIKSLDVEKIVLSSDLGLKKAGWPIEGMSEFLELLRKAGVGSDGNFCGVSEPNMASGPIRGINGKLIAKNYLVSYRCFQSD